MRFLHFKFGDKYNDYLEAETEVAQKEIIAQDSGEATCVRMTSSPWYNLQTDDGRRFVLCHILALLRWHDHLEAFAPYSQDDEIHAHDDEMNSGDEEIHAQDNGSDYEDDEEMAF